MVGLSGSADFWEIGREAEGSRGLSGSYPNGDLSTSSGEVPRFHEAVLADWALHLVRWSHVCGGPSQRFTWRWKEKYIVWPFRKKMTVDYLASVVAEAIEEDIEVLKKAIREHAAENVTEREIDNLVPELWAIELSVIDIVLSSLNPGSNAPALEDLVPMLVVGYAPLEKEEYLVRARYYAERIANDTPNKMTVSIGAAFVSASRIDYKSERSGVNRQALIWAVGAVATGSLQALGSLIGTTLRDYRIF